MNPACVVETSPQNFQAWVSLGMEPMPKDQRKIVAKTLAHEFNADPNSTSATQFGRLAGFTNRNEKYYNNKGYPFVLCRDATGQYAEKSAEIRAWAKKQANKLDVITDKVQTSKIISTNNAKTLHEADLAFKKYYAEWHKVVKFQNKNVDFSRGDFSVVCRMIEEGYLETYIYEAILNNSPNIDQRKDNHVEDYIKRTIRAAQRYILQAK
jgi:hypothetical protein